MHTTKGRLAQGRISKNNPRHQPHQAVAVMNTLRRILALGLAWMLLAPPLPLAPTMPTPAEAQQAPPPQPAPGYDPQSLSVLFVRPS